ncbi:hypothetical protein EDB19DRAFT_1831170 [Suillus lakei]|nr:hypothetical protein EDB19DRAFT_1831170 [Suillus lakei]
MTPLSTKCHANEDISPPNSKCIRDDPDNVDYFVNSLDTKALLEIVQPLRVYARNLVNEREKNQEALQRYQDCIVKVKNLSGLYLKNHRDEHYDVIISGMECSNKTAAYIALMKVEIFELLKSTKL